MFDRRDKDATKEKKKRKIVSNRANNLPNLIRVKIKPDHLNLILRFDNYVDPVNSQLLYTSLSRRDPSSIRIQWNENRRELALLRARSVERAYDWKRRNVIYK